MWHFIDPCGEILFSRRGLSAGSVRGARPPRQPLKIQLRDVCGRAAGWRTVTGARALPKAEWRSVVSDWEYLQFSTVTLWLPGSWWLCCLFQSSHFTVIFSALVHFNNNFGLLTSNLKKIKYYIWICMISFFILQTRWRNSCCLRVSPESGQQLSIIWFCQTNQFEDVSSGFERIFTISWRNPSDKQTH